MKWTPVVRWCWLLLLGITFELVGGEPPTITTEPQDQRVCIGGTASFAVGVIGDSPMHFQWFSNGFPVLDATNATLIISNAVPPDSVFHVFVNNPYGTTNSTPAFLSISLEPIILIQPLDQSTCITKDASFTVQASCGTPLAFTWYRNGLPVTDGVVSNSTTSTLTITNVQPPDNGSVIYVAVTNVYGNGILSTNVNLFVSVNPMIAVQPQDKQVCIGSAASFTVQASCGAPMTFFWYRDGILVPGGMVSTETNSTLTVTNVEPSYDGSHFDVAVSNVFGNVISSAAATLSVTIPPHFLVNPSNQVPPVPIGEPINFVASAQPGNVNYRWWFKGQAMSDTGRISGSSTAHLTINNAQTNDAGYYRVVVQNDCMTLSSVSARCDIGNPPVITTQLVSQVAPFGTNVQFVIGAIGFPSPFYQWYRNDVPLPGQNNPILALGNVQRPQVGVYHVQVWNAFGAIVSDRAHLQIELTYESPILKREEATDEIVALTNALRVWSPPPTVIFHGVPLLFTTYDATAQPWETRCGVPPGHSMWLLYYSPRAERTKVSTEGSDFDTVLGVYTWNGDPNQVPTLVACDNDSGFNGHESLLYFSAQAEKDYYIAVDGVKGATGKARVEVGEMMRKARIGADGRFRMELAGPYWLNVTLRSATNLLQPTQTWRLDLAVATNRDWVVRYTNSQPYWLDWVRLYRTTVSGAPP